MPLEENHIYKFLENPVNERFNSEMIDFLIKRINQLCFEECQVDRIACTLNPMCSKRFLLKLRIKNGLGTEDLPKFCYSVQKGVVERYFKGKTVVYRPSDSYLFLLDFLDIYFHENYRRLNKFLTFKNWDEVYKILEEVRENGTDIHYLRTEKYFLIKYEDYLHVIFLDEGYVICNANRENIKDLELIKGVLELYSDIFFSEVDIQMDPEESVVTAQINIPYEIVSNVADNFTQNTEQQEEGVLENQTENKNYYFWKKFPEELFELSKYCYSIHIDKNDFNDLTIKFEVNTNTHRFNNRRIQLPLRFRDLDRIIEFLSHLYNQFYVIHLDFI